MQMGTSLLDKWSKVRAFVFDIDGVLTDGTLYLVKGALIARTVNIKDGYALQLALHRGYPIAVISGGGANNVRERLEALGLKDIYMRVPNKLEVLREWCAGQQLDFADCLYMGDDVPDLECMHKVGLATCPQDACSDIVQVADYISTYAGGRGCVRDVIERVMKVQGKWELPN